MTNRVELASVEDVSEESNDTISDTRRIASNLARLTADRKRTLDVLGRSKTKSGIAAVTCHSGDPTPLVEAIQKYEDRLRSNETTTFIERDNFMTAEDAEHRDPNIWIELRTFKSGRETIKPPQLFYLGRLVVFKGYGNQIPSVGKLLDLHFTAPVAAIYYGHDSQFGLRPSRMNLKTGKGITYNLTEM
ncbi:uncharacterized protein Z519_08943 [Cladophialophora bantiana CBS 173.52]|uniref:Uncharacterized protein n=1 Tax=Cladophialophora bantiana (strain ATCC 10958 / CBS 173.52 / CDC B-1940 / NIH 8579) TaxID=1442370 RepID=A0A0D2I091_CLAB1|nr:uncharacterized protein Z519_08943 [Cladophialophora bantiana CBS 173.52]KIW90299.1 hypothetical protein Z519_08943 [Cladophialophora bantiana CBS 173.52]